MSEQIPQMLCSRNPPNLKTNKTSLIVIIRKDKQETNSGSIVVKDEYEIYSILIVVWKDKQ